MQFEALFVIIGIVHSSFVFYILSYFQDSIVILWFCASDSNIVLLWHVNLKILLLYYIPWAILYGIFNIYCGASTNTGITGITLGPLEPNTIN